MNTGYLFDTNILIEFYKKRPETVQLIDGLRAQKHSLGISVLTVMELRAGWNEAQAHDILPLLYTFYIVYPLDTPEAELAGTWRKQYAAHGVTIPAIDSLIGATAATHSLTFVTRNTRHFPMSELQLFNIEAE